MGAHPPITNYTVRWGQRCSQQRRHGFSAVLTCNLEHNKQRAEPLIYAVPLGRDGLDWRMFTSTSTLTTSRRATRNLVFAPDVIPLLPNVQQQHRQTSWHAFNLVAHLGHDARLIFHNTHSFTKHKTRTFCPKPAKVAVEYNLGVPSWRHTLKLPLFTAYMKHIFWARGLRTLYGQRTATRSVQKSRGVVAHRPATRRFVETGNMPTSQLLPVPEHPAVENAIKERGAIKRARPSWGAKRTGLTGPREHRGRTNMCQPTKTRGADLFRLSIFAALAFLSEIVGVVVAVCPNMCSGHGECGLDNVCECEAGWDLVADCSLKECPTDVSWGSKVTETPTTAFL